MMNISSLKCRLITLVFILFSLSFLIPQAVAELPKETIKLQSGSVKIRLSAGWSRKVTTELRHSVLFMRESPKGLLSVEIYSLGEIPKEQQCESKAYQMKYLEKLKISLPEADAEIKETSLFNAPTLIHSSFYGEDQFLAKDYHFLKNCKYYIIGFRGDHQYSGEQWSEIDAIFRSIEFL